MIAVPRLATAATVVAEPTGGADPAFLAELKASLETVAAEAPAELDAELRSSAAVTDAGVELVVELVPNDGKEPIRETRIVSKASALSQARAMARAAIKSYTAPAGVATTAPNVVVQEKPATPPPPALPQKYDRRKALWMSALPTTLLLPAGFVLAVLGATVWEFGATMIALPLTSAVAIVVSSPGYFYVGDWQGALKLMVTETVLAIVADVGFWVDVSQGFHEEDLQEGADCTETEAGCGDHPSHAGVWVGLAALGASMMVGVVGALFVGRAADRANAEWREENKPTVQVTPVAWTDGNGQRTFGLALSGSF
jgi:hypothetical protein